MSIATPFEAQKANFGVVAMALLFAALLVLLDGPIWLVKLVPTQDGPVHLAQADLIARFGWGGALQEPAASFYQWNPRIEPNSAIYLLLAALIRLTGDALVANSLFLSLYGLVWIVAAFAASRAETERPLLPALLLLPIAFGVFIHWGFYNFALGIPLFLLFASFWRGLNGRRDALAFVATAVFLAALYLTHITSVVAACLLLAADGMARAVATFERQGTKAAVRRLLRDGLWAAAAALPVLLLIASFLLAYQNIAGETASTEGGIAQIIRRVVAATYLFTFTRWEVIALAPVLGAIVLAGFVALRRFRSGDLLWPVFFVLVVALSLLNLKTGSALLSERLAPYSGIAIVLAIASRQPAPALARALGMAALSGLVGQTAVRAVAYESWAPTLESELAAGRDNPGQSFASADLIAQRDSHLFAWRIRPTLHAAQTAALAGRGVGLSSPLPSTRYFGYFPLQYVEARDFMRATPDWQDTPDVASVAKFRAANHGAPQVLIVSSSDEDGVAFAARFGYGDCRTTETGAREIDVCKVATRLSAAND
ncbi:hypothetical protein [Bradyrhizobium uaiense]|uniref:Glycosyltransferase RgtA/B/C/D-like domain-containing protein n=1 Tax=Bradyrhizobium uaiense TaxID=2594946 RepID=A0A6P1BCE5_9BRAD|nr:hypothetical protein [Bradyrhizobium uaiense]NEU95844.1 hypothetical protein [Bradyrhizobium uaiense]